MKFKISVRSYGSSYIATANGQRASATQSARCAAERVALKVCGLINDPVHHFPDFDKSGITLTQTDSNTFLAERPDPAQSGEQSYRDAVV